MNPGPLPPRDLRELASRARALAGRTLADVAAEHALPFEGRTGVRTKGKTGQLLERVLGATGGSAAVHDFPELGVELKTIPVDGALRPLESTYVCTLPLGDAERAEWSTSWVRAKLGRVLWLPIVMAEENHDPSIGEPVFWQATAPQMDVLAGDFAEILGVVTLGGIERLTARTGRWLHVRPKAASSRERTWSVGADNGWVSTVPRGFYLRTRFTAALLVDPSALP